MGSTGWPTRTSRNSMMPTQNCSMTTTRRPAASPSPGTKSSTPSSSATPTSPTPPSTCSAPSQRSPKRPAKIKNFSPPQKFYPKNLPEKFLSVEDDMILPTFAVFSIYYYYINYHHQKLDQKLLHFFLPSANFMINLNFIERMMQSRRANSFDLKIFFNVLPRKKQKNSEKLPFSGSNHIITNCLKIITCFR